MRLLVIDDDEILRSELSQWLTSEGHEVYTADSGAAAFKKLKKRDFDLIFTDLKMPGMNGIEVLKRLKDRRPRSHVIVITAYGTIDTAVEAMKIGADDYICKPFEMEQLQQVLKDISKAIVFEKQIKDVKSVPELLPKDPYEFFKSKVRDDKGLCITPHDPETIRARYGLQGIRILWLSTEEHDDSCIHPRNVYDIKSQIESFFKKNPDGIVFFDGIEALIRQHHWSVLEKFIHEVSTHFVQGSSKFIIALNPDKIEESTLAELKHLVSKPYVQLISESLSNPTRRIIVRFIYNQGSSRFTEIQKNLGLDDAPKLSFHLKKLVKDGILQKDDDRGYSLTGRGKNATAYLLRLEQEVVNDVPNNILLILSTGTR